MHLVSKVYTNIEFSPISEDRMVHSWNRHFSSWKKVPLLWKILEESKLTSDDYKTASFKYQILLQKLEQIFKEDAVFMRGDTRIKEFSKITFSCRDDPCAVFTKLTEVIKEVQKLRAAIGRQCCIS